MGNKGTKLQSCNVRLSQANTGRPLFCLSLYFCPYTYSVWQFGNVQTQAVPKILATEQTMVVAPEKRFITSRSLTVHQDFIFPKLVLSHQRPSEAEGCSFVVYAKADRNCLSSAWAWWNSPELWKAKAQWNSKSTLSIVRPLGRIVVFELYNSKGVKLLF